MKKIILFLAILCCFFALSYHVHADSIDEKFSDQGVVLEDFTTSTPQKNSVGDIYIFDVKNVDYDTKFIISYKDDGLYFNDTKLSAIQEDYLSVSWSLVYSLEYHTFVLYVFSEDGYFAGSSGLSFPFTQWNWDIITSKTPKRYKYSISKTGSVHLDNTSSTKTAFIGDDWWIYGSNKAISTSRDGSSAYIVSTKYTEKDLKPNVKFDYKNYYHDIFSYSFLTSKDVTMTLNNYDDQKYLFQYQFVKSDEIIDNHKWTTHTFANNNYTLTLKNFRENGTIYTRILDVENDYQMISSSSFTFDDIRARHMLFDYTYLCDLQNRDFVELVIDFIQVYNSNYKYEYSYDDTDEWIDVTDGLIIDEENDIYIYKFDEYIQHTINFRVIDEEGMILDSLSTEVGAKLDPKIIVTKSFSEHEIYYDLDFSYFENLMQYNFDYFIESSVIDELNYQITELNDKKYRVTINTHDNDKYEFYALVKFNNVVVSKTRINVTSITDEKNDILADELNSDIDSNNFTSISSMTNVVKNFVAHMGQYLKYISDILTYAFSKLNVYVKSLIITLFILIVICTIINISRK